MQQSTIILLGNIMRGEVDLKTTLVESCVMLRGRVDPLRYAETPMGLNVIRYATQSWNDGMIGDTDDASSFC